MWSTKGFEAESLESLQCCYVDYYCDSFVNDKDVGFICYEHGTGMMVELSKQQRLEFINEVNIKIDDMRS